MKNGVISKEFIKSGVGHTLMTYYRKEVNKNLGKEISVLYINTDCVFSSRNSRVYAKHK